MDKVEALCPSVSTELRNFGCLYRGIVALSEEVKFMDRNQQKKIRNQAIKSLERKLIIEHDKGKHGQANTPTE